MWDTEKEHLWDGTDPVQILRKHKRALKKAGVVLSSSNWTVFCTDVWAGETNPRHWLRTTLVTISIPPKRRKQRAATGKRPIWQPFCGSAQRKELERKANILGWVWPMSKISRRGPSSINSSSEQNHFFLSELSNPLSVSLRETLQLGSAGSLIVYSWLLEGRYLH